VLLRPLAVSRVANAVPGLLIATIAWPVWVESHLETPIRGAAVCTAIVAGSILAVRGYRIGVTCRGDSATVRGFFRTRMIRRDQITELTVFPAIVWHDTAGRRHWSPVIALMDNGRASGATGSTQKTALSA
jgi:hypothetical protein